MESGIGSVAGCAYEQIQLIGRSLDNLFFGCRRGQTELMPEREGGDEHRWLGPIIRRLMTQRIILNHRVSWCSMQHGNETHIVRLVLFPC